MAVLDYLITFGTGLHVGAHGQGWGVLFVVTGFPPGNVEDPQAGSQYRETGVLYVPEPGPLALLLLGLALVVVRSTRSRITLG